MTDLSLIQPAASLEPAESLKIALYGRWCTGKTRQIQTLIKQYGRESIFIVSADKGLNTIAGEYEPKQAWEVTSIESLRTTFELVTKAVKGRVGTWVCFDGFTQACDWIADRKLKEADKYATEVAMGKAHESIEANLKPYKRFVNAAGGLDGQKVYGPIGVDIKLMINAWSNDLNALGCNVLFTLHEKDTVRDRASGPPFKPKMPGETGVEHLMGVFDFVMRLEVGEGERIKALLDPSKMGYYWSRTRENRAICGAIPREIVGFNLADFVEAIRGKGFPKEIAK